MQATQERRDTVDRHALARRIDELHAATDEWASRKGRKLADTAAEDIAIQMRVMADMLLLKLRVLAIKAEPLPGRRFGNEQFGRSDRDGQPGSRLRLLSVARLLERRLEHLVDVLRTESVGKR